MPERLRLAARPSAEASIDILAPVESVWQLITDISLPAEYSDELQRVDLLQPPIGLGATFRGTNSRQGRTWTTTSTVVHYEPPVRFGWAVNNVDNPAATWTFVSVDRGSHVELTYTMQLGPGPSGLAEVIARRPDRESEIIAARIAEQVPQMQRVLEGIRDRAERDGARRAAPLDR
jgi:uncharacterized protein YndB with AHSA1/START domain